MPTTFRKTIYYRAACMLSFMFSSYIRMPKQAPFMMFQMHIINRFIICIYSFFRFVVSLQALFQLTGFLKWMTTWM